MKTDPNVLKSLLSEGLMPKEETLEIARKKGQLTIGIPKETFFQERRVALVPEAVNLLVANGHDVKIETGAGENCNFKDNEYSEAGAQICYSANEIYECDIILKVSPPKPEEVELMKMNQILISALQLSAQPKEVLQMMAKKKVTAIAWDSRSARYGRNCRKYIYLNCGRIIVKL
jgi:alanine dehydrogenase